MKSKTRLLVIGGFLALLAALLGVVFVIESYRNRERKLHLENARLATDLFSNLALAEMSKVTGTKCDASRSGSSGGNGDEFHLTQMHHFYFSHDAEFDPTEAVEQLHEVVDYLSRTGEIEQWLSAPNAAKAHRYCKFAVEEKNDRPAMRMIIHASNYPNGISDSDSKFVEKHEQLEWK